MTATTHRIVFGDSRRMTGVDDRSVHLVVTSPPYWQLKDYGDTRQIGFDDSYEEYINNLNLVWMECCRVLHDGCRLCVNIGDQFARAAYYGRYKVIPIRTEIIRFCETIGFDFMGAIIWQKVTTCNTTGGATIMGSFPYPRNGIVKLDYEHILLFKKHGKPPTVSHEQKEASKLTTEEWNSYFAGHWNFPGEKQSDHIAMFPEELPRRLIRMFSFVGETVLDPFLGSGTTSLAAANTGRNSIGYEISAVFEPLISHKLSTRDVTFEQDPSGSTDDAISRLPYRFSDPLRLDKQDDPRGQSYGSRVSRHDPPRDESFVTVRDVLSPVEIELSDGRTVALHGLTIIDSRRRHAMDFLNSKVRGRQVYCKFESSSSSGDSPRSVYLYLKNRTFVNAHLLKRGLAALDRRQSITNNSLLRIARTVSHETIIGEPER
ncbi:MAG: site-specific DNA-methyltransferase [candidate division Zixibacteria bacterium]|jgi:site-specific DNA-methyltransferase (adenine-specific)|nr:site-specific DNA-methyltransferase [candidate division Zixibacteria bacterium]